MTSDILHKSVDVNVNDDADEENSSSSFFEDFCEGVWEGINSKLAKCLIAIQLILIVASLLVVLGVSQHRLIQMLVNTYDHVKNDAKTSSSSSDSNSNNLAHFIGQKLGSALFKKYMSATNNHNTAAVLSGSIPILIARIMGAPIPTAAKSVGRLLTFAGQTTPITYKPLTWNDRYVWVRGHCNSSIQYPGFYGDTTCCYQTKAVCCPNYYNPQYCYDNYDKTPHPYMCYQCLYPPRPTFKDNMMATMSMLKSFVATFYYAQQVPLPASLSTAASAMSPLALPQALDFIAAQGDLNPLVHLGEIPCTEFISSVKKVTWSGTFTDGDNQVRNWNVESEVNTVTSTMSEVCSKMASAKPAAGETLPPDQRRITPSPAGALDETEEQQDNNNKNSSSPSSSSSSQESPQTRIMKVLTYVFAGLIIVLSLVLIVILVRTIFSWWSCSEGNTNDTTNEHEEEQEEEDLVYELFHRRHNQILLLINCILVLAIAFTCVSAVSYSDFLHKAEDFIHRHTENPQELGVNVAKALFKVHQASNKNKNKNKNLEASTTTNEPLFGIVSNIPQLAKNAMLINIPQLSWHVSDFTSHLDARVAYSFIRCRDRDTQQHQLPSYCKNAVSDMVRSIVGSAHNSLVNLVFGSYLGNVAVTEKNKASDSSSSSMFCPISMINWASRQLSANSNYLQLNSTSCHPFVKSLNALTLSGTWNDASNGNALVVWDARSTKTAVAAALSEICSEAASAADVATTTMTADVPTHTPSPGSSPTTTTATTGPGGSTVAPASNNNDTPSPNGGDDDKSSSSPPLSTGVIAGLAAGAGLLILLLLVFFLFKKKKISLSAFQEPNAEIGTSMQNVEAGAVEAQQQPHQIQEQQQSAENDLEV